MLAPNGSNLDVLKTELERFRVAPFGDNLGLLRRQLKPMLETIVAGVSNLTSKLGQIGPKWDKSGTF